MLSLAGCASSSRPSITDGGADGGAARRDSGDAPAPGLDGSGDGGAIDAAAGDAAPADATTGGPADAPSAGDAADGPAAIDAGGGGDGGDGGDGGGACGTRTFSTRNLRPDLLLVLDKSGSMANDFTDTVCSVTTSCGASNPTKWDGMFQALDTVVAQTQGTINWGIKYFSTNNQCAVSPGVTVGVAADNASAILTSIAQTIPGGLTPTAAAEASAALYLAGLTDPNPKFILLATDGLPNCAPGAASTSTPDDPHAIQTVLDAFNGGIPTFVLGIGNVAVAQATLNAMAVNGGEAQPADASGRVYFPAEDPTALVSALSTIAARVVPCTFTLGSPPPAPDDVVVLGETGTIPRDAANGWSYGPGMTSIVLGGASCDAVKSGAIETLQVIFGCPPTM